VALVRERAIPTERPPPVGEVSANFCIYIYILESYYLETGNINIYMTTVLAT